MPSFRVTASVLAFLLGSVAANAQTPSESTAEVEAIALRLFNEGCVPNLGNGDASESAAKKAGLAPAGHPLEEFLDGQRPGKVWSTHRADNNFAAVTRPDGADCMVVLQHASLADVERSFRMLTAAAAKPGLLVIEVPDNPRQPDDPMRVVSYRLHTEGPGPAAQDRLLSLRIDTGPKSFFPVMLTAKLVTEPAPPPSLETSARPPGTPP